MEQRLTIITLGVSDLAKATKFYEDAIGWTRSGSSNDNISFFQMNGMLLSLYPRDKLAKDAGVPAAEAPAFSGCTVAYNCRSREEVDKVFADLKAKRVTIVKEPETVFWGGYSGYFGDPDGNLWEVAYNPFLKLDEKGNVLEG